MQTTDNILMIRPVQFGYNAQTAVNNAFQVDGDDGNVQNKALEEFDTFVKVLRSNGVSVTVVEDTPKPHTPDSIFPNNWISFHSNGAVVLYPMYAENRRMERKQHVLETISENFAIERIIDLTHYEDDNIFLEGTGSMVLDRDKRIAYACISARTDKTVLEDFCDKAMYQPEAFEAVDKNGSAIYHTNVMMCVGDRYVVICLDSIHIASERDHVINTIKHSGKELVDITLDQMNHFAGNMLQVATNKGEKLLVMSTQAYESLTVEQIKKLTGFNRIVHSSLNTIEKNGGGSARCMMAEIHLPTIE
ncbi:citrulline utilization hydrolase CtlX [Pinibacter aurantiacus]|uniref:Amidinotransferase n=1 Tax=Pinibacter aurantiacus TaxID=2851599 RepID=A0A9E2SFK1_9BACT|nr:arginine deiminase-related protein [Pinibacter aurantiacus]MBV4359350.1 amidinotransferase [Pinibacter aurantiacus]